MSAQINQINENQCIGDSLEQINKNFAALNAVVEVFKDIDLTSLTTISNDLATLKNTLNNLPS